MKKTNEIKSITIDNKVYQVPKGTTILKAAEQNDIYIPTLCAHKELSPHGGCRMCIVEVEGFCNFPTACTTPVDDGMVIRTDTVALTSVRTEILQLFMSEHTSSCLICPESIECRKWMGTVRKAGVTTGCRYCPNDGQCEFQDVVEKMGIKEIKYPIYYRNNRVQKEDPFYDRDYNLCILCGRCVRMCQEIRTANVLAFNYRGRETVIGPAYGRTHVESGCEFCGACVAVCPTGALSEKDCKWEGKPDREEVTTCSFCGVGCQMRLQIKDNRIISSLPVINDEVNNGQLCVRGRFCISEVVNGYQRLVMPYRRSNGIKDEISWDEAIDTVAARLTECSPDEFRMRISPNSTNEDLYVAQKFARLVMRSNNIETTAKQFYGAGLNAYMKLAARAVPLSELRKASVILAVGLDTRFGRSVVAVELRKAVKGGAKIISIHPRQHNLSMIAEHWLRPLPGSEQSNLKKLVALTEKKSATAKGELAAVAKALKEADSPVILVGSEYLQYDNNAAILSLIDQLAGNIGAGVMPLPAQNNLYGTYLMGAYPEILPGGFASSSTKRLGELKKAWQQSLPRFKANGKGSSPDTKVLYLIGAAPPVDQGSDAEFVVTQNIYPPDEDQKVDLVLPAAAFTETEGTFISGAGRLQRVRKAVDSRGQAWPDWKILCRIARKMGVKGFDYKKASDIHREIATLIDGFGKFNKPDRKAQTLTMKGEFVLPKSKRRSAVKTDKKLPYLLSACSVEHVYRGMPLSTWVDGSRKIFSEGVVEMNPADARKARLTDGDLATVSSDHLKQVWPVKITESQPPGTLYIVLPQGESIGVNPQPVKVRKKHV